MTSMYYASPVYSMVDRSKGSMTNRFDCAKEHAKNNFICTTKLSLAGAGATVLAYTKPNFAVRAAKFIGQGAAKVATKLGGKGLGAKILKNPTKFGAAGMIAAGALWALNTICKHTYKSGQIDQKYTDAAKIESQTKNVVLV